MSEVVQSSPSLKPHGLKLPGSSIHGIFQARILEWVAISSPGDLPDLRIEPWSPALQADSSLSEAPCKPPRGSSYLLYYFCDCSAGSIQTKGNKLSIE